MGNYSQAVKAQADVRGSRREVILWEGGELVTTEGEGEGVAIAKEKIQRVDAVENEMPEEEGMVLPARKSLSGQYLTYLME